MQEQKESTLLLLRAPAPVFKLAYSLSGDFLVYPALPAQASFQALA
jgi:hypothetical protein